MEFRYLQSDYIAPLVLTTYENDKPEMYKYNSLAELNADWEDVPEEPKEYWRIDCDGTISRGEDDFDTPFDNACKEIGNYFSSREEAEKALEKLKAWKRLKDKGFRFNGWDNTDRSTIHNFSLSVTIENLESINKDLDLLFSGGGE